MPLTAIENSCWKSLWFILDILNLRCQWDIQTLHLYMGSKEMREKTSNNNSIICLLNHERKRRCFLFRYSDILLNKRKCFGLAIICPPPPLKLTSWAHTCIRCLPVTSHTYFTLLLYLREAEYLAQNDTCSDVAEEEDSNVLPSSKTWVLFSTTMWQLPDLNFRSLCWHANWYYIFMHYSHKAFWGTLLKAEWQVGILGTMLGGSVANHSV